jgi:PEP-CTERM motif
MKFPLRCLAMFATAIGFNANAAVYDPTAGFSILNGNPNGVWSYGYSEDLDLADFSANFTQMSQAFGPDGFGISWGRDVSGPFVSLNTSGTTQYAVPPGMLTQHPGPSLQASLLRFTAPESADINVAGTYFAGDSGNMLLAILVNGTSVWTGNDSGSFNFNSNLLAGGTIDFAVYGGYGFGNTPLALTITTSPVPEPSTSAVLAGAALFGLAATRRRRRV